MISEKLKQEKTKTQQKFNKIFNKTNFLIYLDAQASYGVECSIVANIDEDLKRKVLVKVQTMTKRNKKKGKKSGKFLFLEVYLALAYWPEAEYLSYRGLDQNAYLLKH